MMRWNEHFQVKCQLVGMLPLLLMCFSNVFITAALLPLGRGTAKDHRCWGESMDVRNLSFIHQWRQARPKYGRVNTNHRSSRDTDTHRQTAINTAHIHKICLCRHMLSCVHAAGHGSHHKRASVGLLQITFFHFFPPLSLSLSSSFPVSLSFYYF